MFLLQYLQIWNACITFFAQPYLVNKFSCKEAHGFAPLSMVNNYKCNEPFLQQHFVKLYLIIDSLKLSTLLSTMLKIKPKNDYSSLKCTVTGALNLPLAYIWINSSIPKISIQKELYFILYSDNYNQTKGKYL